MNLCQDKRASPECNSISFEDFYPLLLLASDQVSVYGSVKSVGV